MALSVLADHQHGVVSLSHEPGAGSARTIPARQRDTRPRRRHRPRRHPVHDRRSHPARLRRGRGPPRARARDGTGGDPALFDLKAVNAVLDAADGRRGAGVLREVLADLEPVTALPESANELDDLLSDLPPSGGLERVLHRAVVRTSTTLSGLRAAWHEPALVPLALPRSGREVTLGRSPECDYVIAADTVSRRHAHIRRAGERWFLRDLASRNGTRLNGWRVVDEVEVAPGDRLSLGAVRFRLTASS